MVFGTLLCHAQQEESLLQIMNHQIPAAPNTAALGRYGEIPVSYYTGQTNVSIPIYQIVSGELSVPVSLNYQPIFKVQDIPSWVGSGWTLSAGGVIGLSVRGRPDYSPGGYCRTPAKHPQEILNPFEVNLAIQNYIETQPDSYQLTTPNSSLSFLPADTCTLEACEFVGLPYDQTQIKLKIKSNGETYWEVRDNKGFLYIFGETSDGFGLIEESRIASVEAVQIPVHISGWYLAKMFNPGRTDSICFKYDMETIEYEAKTGVTYTAAPLGMEQHVQCGIQQVFPGLEEQFTYFDRDQARLKEIVFAEGSMHFEVGAERLDLPGSYPLQTIELRNKEGDPIKEWELETGYFSSGTEPESKRLKLIAVSEISGADAIVHACEYYEEYDVPSYKDMQYMDHWGFLNGNSGSPLAKFNEIPGQEVVYEEGGDRNADPAYAEAFLLRKLTYPTSGYTEFEYEGNRASWMSDLSNLRTYDTLGINVKAGFFANQLYEADTFQLADGAFVYQSWNLAFITPQEGDAFANTYIERIDAIDPNAHTYAIGSEMTYNERFVWLEAGTYQVVAEADYPSKASQNLQIYIPHQSYDKPVGGARIKKLTNVSNAGVSTVRTFDYTYAEDTLVRSSGVIATFPNYCSGSQVEITFDIQNFTGLREFCQLQTYSSSSMSSITGSNHLGYRRVRVSDGNGFEQFEYTTAKEYPVDILYNYFPYPPHSDNSFKLGQLKVHSIFNKDSLLMQRTINEQTFDLNKHEIVHGVSYSIFTQRLAPFPNEVIKKITGYVSQWKYTPSTKRVEYFNNGTDSTWVDQAFEYDPESTNLIRELTELADRTLVKSYEYAKDGTPVEDEMLERNMVAVPVQADLIVIENGDSTRAASTKIVYKQAGENIVPDHAYQLNTASNEYELVKAFITFDASGKILEELNKDGMRVSYVWGYHSTKLIAKLVGIGYTTMTANQLSAIEDAIAASDADVDHCTASTCTEELLRVALRALMEEFSPYHVQGFTHDPLVGVTGILDSNGRQMTYQYDGFGRPIQVRDDEGNVVTKHEYILQGN